MAVSKRLRFEIFRRDNFTCRYCGRSSPDVQLEPDHIVPVTLGGSDKPGNLVTACVDCNSGKTSIPSDAPLVEDVAADALRWSRAMERAAEQQREDRERLAQFRNSVARMWIEAHIGVWVLREEPDRKWHYTSDPDRTYPWVLYKRPDYESPAEMFDTAEEATDFLSERARRLVPPRPEDWDASLGSWLAAGIDREDVAEAARIAAKATHVDWHDRYRYFAGVIWRKLEERQEIARALIEEGGDDGA